MEKVLSLLREAMEKARIISVVTFDPELFLFTSAMQVIVKKAEDYVHKKKRTAGDVIEEVNQGLLLALEMDRYTRMHYQRRLL